MLAALTCSKSGSSPSHSVPNTSIDQNRITFVHPLGENSAHLATNSMPRSLRKVSKKVTKKKGKVDSLHENSRDAQLLRRAVAREDKLAKISALRAKSNEPICKASKARIMWSV